MCHLVLLLPLLALPVFWLLPLSVAIPVYLLSLVVTWLAWRFIMRALHRPVVTGARGLVGAAAEVVAVNTGSGPRFTVRTGGELWSARCDAPLRPGDSVVVRDVEGLRLRVSPYDAVAPATDTDSHCR